MMPSNGAPLAEIRDLSVRFVSREATVHAVNGVSFSVQPGEVLCILGESGSGKTMTARAVGRLLPDGADIDGTIHFDGRDVRKLDGAELKRFRAEVAMIFQDPRAHINPVRRIGDFMTEALRTNAGVPARQAKRRSVELLARVGVGARQRKPFAHRFPGAASCCAAG